MRANRSRTAGPAATRSLPSQPAPHQPPSGDLTSWPRRGTSIYGLLTDGAWDYAAFADRLTECGFKAPLTRFWLLSAAWAEVGSDLVLPFGRTRNGEWDLFAWSDAYFNRLVRIVETMNARGIVCVLDVTELYGWSHRKQGLSGVPDPSNGPWRRNVNGLHWDDDDTWFTTEPGSWLNAFIELVVAALKDTAVVWEIGNEMPEKALHYRIRDVIRRVAPDAQVSVNRNEDVPGQYANMAIGRDFDRIAFHGKRDLGFLDEAFDNGEAKERPDTFRKLLDGRADNSRIVFSSDGARASMDPVNGYDWPRLLDVARYVTARGCGFEHQSVCKLERIRSGRADLNVMEMSWLRELAQL